MDLPELRISHESSSSGVASPVTPLAVPDPEPVSPDMSSTAERFARHQCTLRKKPEKPALMRKPVITPGQQQHSPLILRHRFQARSTEGVGPTTTTTTTASSCTTEQEIQTE
uniref:Uncharacterized protein n=1 Tax=Cacopsylla melanoneura TaxID=428564 RepID=A0A8D9A049_9HEMI